MKNHKQSRMAAMLVALAAMTLFFSLPAAAQSNVQKSTYPIFELGGVLTGVAGNGLGGDTGIGGRATYIFYHDPEEDDIQGLWAVEGEMNWLPVENQPTLFRGGKTLEGLFRFKLEIGDVDERLGLKAGSGFVSSDRAVRAISLSGNPFAPTITPARFGRLTEPALEFGVVYERFRKGSHWGLRFDAGDVIVLYPDLPGLNGVNGKNHFQFSTALVYRIPMARKTK